MVKKLVRERLNEIKRSGSTLNRIGAGSSEVNFIAVASNWGRAYRNLKRFRPTLGEVEFWKWNDPVLENEYFVRLMKEAGEKIGLNLLTDCYAWDGVLDERGFASDDNGAYDRNISQMFDEYYNEDLTQVAHICEKDGKDEDEDEDEDKDTQYFTGTVYWDATRGVGTVLCSEEEEVNSQEIYLVQRTFNPTLKRF